MFLGSAEVRLCCCFEGHRVVFLELRLLLLVGWPLVKMGLLKSFM